MDRPLTATFTRYNDRTPATTIEARLMHLQLLVFAKQNIDVNNSLRRNAG
jgi:hypothetical protein